MPQEKPVARSYTHYLILFLKGMAMGAADSVPGVSGGTIAVIARIFDELVYSIRAVDLAALQLLLRGRIREAWFHINGTFLLVLLCGIVLSLRLAAGVVLYLMEAQFEPLMAFFVGLVLASTWTLKDRFVATGAAVFIALVSGFLLTWLVSNITPRAIGEVPLPYLFFCGMVGICAMILPGISGAFLLLVLGVYEYLLAALLDWNWPVIVVFVTGAALGLMSFSRFLAWALRHYHNLSYAFLTGMLLASVLVLWPWQEVTSFSVDPAGGLHPLQHIAVMPWNYEAATGQPARWPAVIVALVAGLALIIGFEKLFRQSAD